MQPHKYATYGIVPSTAPSSEDESEDTLPRATLNAPIEALQGLANAAAEAAAAPSTAPPVWVMFQPNIICLYQLSWLQCEETATSRTNSEECVPARHRKGMYSHHELSSNFIQVYWPYSPEARFRIRSQRTIPHVSPP